MIEINRNESIPLNCKFLSLEDFFAWSLDVESTVQLYRDTINELKEPPRKKQRIY